MKPRENKHTTHYEQLRTKQTNTITIIKIHKQHTIHMITKTHIKNTKHTRHIIKYKSESTGTIRKHRGTNINTITIIKYTTQTQ